MKVATNWGVSPVGYSVLTSPGCNPNTLLLWPMALASFAPNLPRDTEKRLGEIPHYCTAYEHVLQICQGVHPFLLGRNKFLSPIWRSHLWSLSYEILSSSAMASQKRVRFFPCDAGVRLVSAIRHDLLERHHVGLLSLSRRSLDFRANTGAVLWSTNMRFAGHLEGVNRWEANPMQTNEELKLIMQTKKFLCTHTKYNTRVKLNSL